MKLLSPDTLPEDVQASLKHQFAYFGAATIYAVIIGAINPFEW